MHGAMSAGALSWLLLMNCLAALEEAIVAAKIGGGVPFFVGTTAGTTVLGAFDPLPAIVEVLHVPPHALTFTFF